MQVSVNTQAVETAWIQMQHSTTLRVIPSQSSELVSLSAAAGQGYTRIPPAISAALHDAIVFLPLFYFKAWASLHCALM